jgi:hypothetical protein
MSAFVKASAQALQDTPVVNAGTDHHSHWGGWGGGGVFLKNHFKPYPICHLPTPLLKSIVDAAAFFWIFSDWWW